MTQDKTGCRAVTGVCCFGSVVGWAGLAAVVGGTT